MMLETNSVMCVSLCDVTLYFIFCAKGKGMRDLILDGLARCSGTAHASEHSREHQ